MLLYHHKSTTEVLENVAHRFERGQWTRGHRGFGGYYCLVGAISYELYRGPDYSTKEVERVVRELGFKSLQSAYHFNDIRGRAAVVEKIRWTLDMMGKRDRLGEALDESRLAHARRDAQRDALKFPEAWTKEVRELEVVA